MKVPQPSAAAAELIHASMQGVRPVTLVEVGASAAEVSVPLGISVAEATALEVSATVASGVDEVCALTATAAAAKRMRSLENIFCCWS